MIHAEEILKLKKVIHRLYVKHTGQTTEDIGKKFSFEFSSFDFQF
jgi:ATP-dependent protease ClpP protease subunit